MKKHYKGMLLFLCAVLLLGLAGTRPCGAEVPATALPLGGFPMGNAKCVNNAGQCAGYLTDNEYKWYACFWDFETLTPTLLDQAGDGVLDDCTETAATCINSDGKVAGTGWYDTGDEGNWYSRGFIWTQADGMVDIGTLLDGDGWAEPVDINDSGQVLADSYDYNVDRNFLWTAGTRTELTYTDNGTVYPIGIGNHSINNSGQVAGYVADWALRYAAVLWENGTTTILTPGVNTLVNRYINNNGQVAGIQNGGSRNPWIYTPGEGLRFIDVTAQYPDLSNGTISVGGINDQGQVLIYQRDPVIRAMVWEDDGFGGDEFTDIPVSCLIKPDTNNFFALLFNDQGQVVGGENSTNNARVRNFFWNPATPDGIALLAPLPGTQKTVVKGLNDSGLAVGHSSDASYTTALPCMWQTDGIAMTYPPVLDASAAPATGLVGSNISFMATATDPDAGDTFAFSLDPGSPAGATIDSSTGDFSWTPAAAGQFTFTIRVDDSDDLSDTAEVTIDVIEDNEAPTLTLPATTFSGMVGGNLTFTATATDPDLPDDTLTFQLSGAPVEATIHPTTGVFSWTPVTADYYQFSVEVVDAKGAKDSKLISVSVAASPLAVFIEQIVREGKWVKVLLGIENTGTDKAKDVMVGSATLDGVETTSRLPISLGAFKPGGTKNCELKFDGTSVLPGSAMLSVSGDSSLGGFSGTIEVLVP